MFACQKKAISCKIFCRPEEDEEEESTMGKKTASALILVLGGICVLNVRAQNVLDLLKTFESSDAQARDAAVKALAKLGLAKISMIFVDTVLVLGPHLERIKPEGKMMNEDPVIERILSETARALAAMGPEAAEPLAGYAISGGISVDSELSLRALEKMGVQGRRAIPIFKKTLESDDIKSSPRWGAMMGLVFVDGPEFPTLLGAIRSRNGDVRGTAVIGLGKTRSPVALKPVLAALQDPEGTVRQYAAEALGDLGPIAAPAIPELLLNHQEYLPSIPFGKIGETAIPFLKKALLEGKPPSCGNAGRALGKMGTLGLPVLLGAMSNPDPAVRKAAVEGVSWIEDESKGAADILAKAWLDDDPSVREEGLLSLPMIRGEAGRLAPEFIAGLKSPSASRRMEAAMALAKIGRFGKPAIPALLAALSDAIPAVRAAAAQALGLVGGDPAEVVPKLIPLIKDSEANVRQGAVFALGTLKSGSAGLKAILQALEDTDRAVGLEAVMSLQGFGSAAGTVKPVLLGFLKSTDKDFCREALGILFKFGLISEAKPLVANYLNSPDMNFRLMGIETIERLGAPLPAETKPILERLQKSDPEQSVRVAALAALDRYRQDPTMPPPPPPPPPLPPGAPMFRSEFRSFYKIGPSR
jgi:HEAT repeat protein